MNSAETGPCRIVALQGASSLVIQDLLQGFATRLTASGLRVAGVIETAADSDNPCKSMVLRSLDDGRLFSISQDLGPGSQSCNLHPEGLALACAAVQDSIAAGADVVILSKFGKQEAAGRGLSDAFGAAVAAGLPIITAVSPAMMADWQNFSGEYAECVQAEVAQHASWLESWSQRMVTAGGRHDIMQRSGSWIGTA
jgi:Protein of unknown function (DUF2478)